MHAAPLKCVPSMLKSHIPPAVFRGREAEVPDMALETLERTKLRHCKQMSSHAEEALRIVQVSTWHSSCFPQDLALSIEISATLCFYCEALSIHRCHIACEVPCCSNPRTFTLKGLHSTFPVAVKFIRHQHRSSALFRWALWR